MRRLRSSFATLAIFLFALSSGAFGQFQTGNDNNDNTSLGSTAPESTTGGLDAFSRGFGELTVGGMGSGGNGANSGLGGLGGLSVGRSLGIGGIGGGLGGGFGGLGGMGGFGGGFRGGQFNQNSQNQQNSIRATMRLGFSYPMPSPETRAQDIATRVGRIPLEFSNRNVNIQIQGKKAILSGVVEDASQAKIMRGLMLLEPGIYEVENNLTYPGKDGSSGNLEVVPPPPPTPSR